MEPYKPEWDRADSPTKGMRDGELLAYYKRWALLGDVRFLLAVSKWLDVADRAMLEGLYAKLQAKKATRADAIAVIQVCARNRQRWLEAERQPKPVVYCGGGWTCHRV